jgi:ATP-binding cassette subfamily B protein
VFQDFTRYPLSLADNIGFGKVENRDDRVDEPTAWLDAKGEAEFFDRFLDITRGLTTVVISHRFSTVRRADHIVVLDGGCVVEEGTHESLVAERGRYAEAFRLQASRFGDAAASKSENGAPDA